MSVWKSPIIYVGLALVLFVCALLSAPFVIDWNSYRASLEAYGRELTGRNVIISGDISARLFPWPLLRLEGVRIANPSGAFNADLVNAEAIEARMLLGSLLSGYIEVSDIRMERPVFAFERLESGEGSWWLAPRLNAGVPIGAERILVENLEIIDGKVLLSDSRRGGTARIDEFDAVLSAPTLLGPWKARGELRQGSQVLALGVSTGRHRPGDPLKFTVKLSPVQGAGLVYAFDGEYSSRGDAPVSGVLRVEPPEKGNGSAGSETTNPVSFKAKLSFKEDHALLQDIEIVPLDREQAGNLLTGSAAIELQSRISVLANLRAPKFDLDEMLGEDGREILKSGAVLESAAQLVEALPEGVDGRLVLSIGTLVAGGANLENAKLEAELADRGLVVHELSAGVPGQTKTRFKGLLFANAESPLLAGDIEVEAANMRDFVSWLMPEWKEAIAAHWSGTRGKLLLRSKLDYAPQSLRLSDTEFSLDESSGSGDVALSVANPGGSSIRLRLDSLDLDRYLADGLRMAVSPSGILASLGGMTRGAHALGNLDLALNADRMVFNGTQVEGVKADIATSGEILDVRSLTIGDVGGAKLQISGALEPRPEGGTGSATIKVDAADPRPLFRLFGMLPQPKVGVAEPRWVSELAPLHASLSALLDKKESESQLTLELRGNAGGSNIALDSTFLGDLQDPRAGRLQMSAGIASPNARKLASIFGFSHVADDRRQAQLSLRLDGELASGVLVETEFDALGGKGTFRGKTNGLFAAQGTPQLEGALEIAADNGDQILQALGIAIPRSASGLAIKSKLMAKTDELLLQEAHASLGGQQFEGQLSARPGGIDIAARADALSAPWLLALALMPMDGGPIDDVKLFAEAPLHGAKGKVVIDAEKLVLTPGIALAPGRLALDSTGRTLDVSISGTGARGTPFSVKADVAREGSELRVAGSLNGGFELGDVLSSANGEPVIDSLVTFKSSVMGRGRSPAGLAASLSGSGEVSIERGYVRGIDADSFMAGLRFSPTAASVDRLLRQGFTGSDLIFSGSSGSVSISEGVATFGPIAFEAGGIRGSLKTVLELLSRKIDMGLELGLKALSDVPPIEVIYSGSPRSLERTVDASELKARLSAVELQRSMEKLEELQREQMELFAEEERQAKAEAAERAEAEKLRATSQANRMRAEEAALRRLRNEQEKAAAALLQHDLDELKRKSEAIARQRQEEERQRGRDSAADRRDLRSRSALAEGKFHVRRAEEAAVEDARKQAELLETQRQRFAEQAARMAEERRKREEAAQRERKRLAEEAARRAAEEAERRRAAEEAERKAEEERKAREAALKAEEERKAREAALKAEEERKAREAALKAEEERKAREAALKAEEERKAREAALKAEEERKAREAALKAEEERKAREAALKAAEERRAREAALKAEEERKAREAAIALERQRKAEDEARARQAALLLEQEIKRKAEEERRRAEEAARRAEEAARQAEEQRRAKLAALAAEAERRRLAEVAARRAREEERRREAALALERQRLAEEAERKRQEELRRAETRALEQMNVRELLRQRQRAEAWSTIDQRAKEKATAQALEDAKAKIDQLLREAAKSNSMLGPSEVPEPEATKSISPKSDQPPDDMPPAEPLPLDEEEVRGPTLIDPSSITSSISNGQIDATDDNFAEEAAPRNRRSEAEPTWLQRLERMIRLPPASAKREPNLRKRYNFNR